MAVMTLNKWVVERNDVSCASVIQFPDNEKNITTNNNKKKGKKSEVYPFQLDDAKKMIEYFKCKNMWLQYLLFVLSWNTARRVGDMLNLTWEHLYNPITGQIRDDMLEIVEDKTDKLANPRINNASKSAIERYVKETGVNVKNNNYHDYVFMQLTGTHKGNVITSDGWRKSLKKAAEEVGINYNIGTHSTRKSFGMISRMIHPNDYDSMELLQTIYNHSDTKTTKHYIGLTKQKIDKYYDDMGDFFEDYIIGNKEYKDVAEKPVITIEVSDLRDIISLALNEDNANIDTMNEIMSLVESLAK